MTAQVPEVDDVWDADQPVRRRAVALDVAVAVALGFVAAAAVSGQSRWAVLVAVLTALAVALRRFALRVAVVTAIGPRRAEVASGDVNVAADLGFAPVAFALGSHRNSGVRRFGLGGALVGVVGAATWAATQNSVQDLGLARSLIAAIVMSGLAAVVLLGGWVTGFLRWQRADALRSRGSGAP